MMLKFGSLQKLDLRSIWQNEAIDFTPWLADNISALGETLGMELELVEKEANVGDFSLDLLAKDLGTGDAVIIENQLTSTDHDHLGKLLTYAAGFDASTVIWIAGDIREEHRQALEWLNQRTDSQSQFFGIVVEVLRIDDSSPAYNFKLVVYPNEWQKTRRVVPGPTPRAEAYRNYFQLLIDELRERYKFTGAKIAQPQNWYSFASGFTGITYAASYAQGGQARVEIYIDKGDSAENKRLFDWLAENQDSIEQELGGSLAWERLDDKQASRIAMYRPGSIDDNAKILAETRQWQIKWLLKLKQVFPGWIKKYAG